ncbi:MAG: DUF6036 family nucleotidyltransferase [Polyangiales bacterium]
MRPPVDKDRIDVFLRTLGRRATGPGTLYLVGGSCAAWLGWRPSTVDIDLKLDPEPAGVFAAIAELKNQLQVNVELASPDNFVPAAPGWRERSVYVDHFGPIEVRHYDFVTQALAKIERGTKRDLEDVRAMLRTGVVTLESVRDGFKHIQAELPRYPGLNPEEFAERVQALCASQESS